MRRCVICGSTNVRFKLELTDITTSDVGTKWYCNACYQASPSRLPRMWGAAGQQLRGLLHVLNVRREMPSTIEGV